MRALDYVERPPASGDNFQRVTVNSWETTRGNNYQIAHRGAGDVLPENSMEAFNYAVNVGAKAMEVSVAALADGTLVVNHDLTWDRTTTDTGDLRDTPSSELAFHKIDNQPQTGEGWVNNPPQVVLFEDVLRHFGGRVVMCVEAKDDAAYPDVIAMIEKYGLDESTIIKAYYTSTRIAEAKAAGYKTFVYIAENSFTQPILDSIVASGNADYLVVPAWSASGTGFMWTSDSLIQDAVATGLPVWVYPVHRRADVSHFAELGVEGFISSSIGYTSTDTPLLTADRWGKKIVAPGEVVINPADSQYAVSWDGTDELVLDRQSIQFLCLGSFCPIPGDSYAIQFEVCWKTLPIDTTNKIWLSWGRADDRYYQTSYNPGLTGNHAYVRLNGNIGLNRHGTDGNTNGSSVEVATSALTANTWVSLRLEVTPTQAVFTRLDGTPVSTPAWVDSTNRGRYLYVGKTSGDGVLAIRNMMTS